MNTASKPVLVMRPIRWINGVVTASLLMLNPVSVIADPASPTHKIDHEQLTQCAAIKAAAPRLDCFDRLAAPLLDTQNAASPATVVDVSPKATPTEDVPEPNVATSDQSTANATFADVKEPTSISVKLIEARRSARDYWILTFDNGQIWRQNDSRRRSIRNLPLDATISESVLGSYTLKIAGQRWSMKVRRLR